jgi:hypothetical protein
VVLVNTRPRAVEVTVSAVSVNGARDLIFGGLQDGERVVLEGYRPAVLELRQ